MSEQMSKTRSEAELKSAIVAFEQILDAEPNDRLALETLADSYAKLGETAQALTYLTRLADAVIAENDMQAAKDVAARLKLLPDSPAVQDTLKRLREHVRKSGAALAPEMKEVIAHDITREVSLAWDLMQAGELSEEDYAQVVQDLSENSGKRLEVPVTVLHALHDRNHKGLEKVVAYLARASGRPFISLSHYEVQLDLVGLLPNEYLTHRGAVVYERIGRDLLVAVLNPFDLELQEDVRRLTDRRCHFCVVNAVEYDNMLLNIRKMRESAI